MPKDRSFVECAQDLIETSAREVEARMEVEEPRWTRIEYQRPRNMPNPWRRREHRDAKRERNINQENRASQARSRNNGRWEDRKCHGCGKVGHIVAHCPRTRYFKCGAEGHIARQCPYMYRRKEQNKPEPMPPCSPGDSGRDNGQQQKRTWRRTGETARRRGEF
nr:uncharacterized protein LOC106688911 [Halyomorpha halys]